MAKQNGYGNVNARFFNGFAGVNTGRQLLLIYKLRMIIMIQAWKRALRISRLSMQI